MFDTALAVGKESIGPLLDFGNQELYISALQKLAAKLTIVGGGEKKRGLRQQRRYSRVFATDSRSDGSLSV